MLLSFICMSHPYILHLSSPETSWFYHTVGITSRYHTVGIAILNNMLLVLFLLQLQVIHVVWHDLGLPKLSAKRY